MNWILDGSRGCSIDGGIVYLLVGIEGVRHHGRHCSWKKETKGVCYFDACKVARAYVLKYVWHRNRNMTLINISNDSTNAKTRRRRCRTRRCSLDSSPDIRADMQKAIPESAILISSSNFRVRGVTSNLPKTIWLHRYNMNTCISLRTNCTNCKNLKYRSIHPPNSQR